MFRFVPGFTSEELERTMAQLEQKDFLPAHDPWLRAGGVKVTADGGVETGFIRQPFAYTDDPREPNGKLYASAENLQAFCVAASEAGWQVGIHCVGDAAIDAVLDAYEAAHVAAPLNGRRWALIHMMAARPEHFPRARAMDLIITAQQPLQYTLAAGFRKYWGPERAEHIEPLRAYLESGLIVGGGSDSPVTPYQPLLGIWSSVTRETHLAGVQGPQWAIPVKEAVGWYTIGSAACAFEENVKGTLEPGKYADIVVLSDDPLTVETEALLETKVLMTMVDGRVVWEAA
jgi:predicted amidohydrolase YtcJ